MAYKENLYSNNVNLQNILNAVNNLEGGKISFENNFMPTDQGSNFNRLKIRDNNTDLQKLLETVKSLPNLLTITYDANGGYFDSNQTTNTVNYAIGSKGEAITKISKTTQLDDNGEKINGFSSGYASGECKYDIIKIDGAETLDVTITYQTYGSGDWASVYDSSALPNGKNSNLSVTGALGGFTKTTKNFTINGDTVQFYFQADNYSSISSWSSDYYYGYFATVTGVPKLPMFAINGFEKIPVKNNHFLYGWYLDADCSDGQELDLNNIDLNNITVYAKWIEKNPEVLLIDFDYVDNGDGTYTLIDWKQTYNGESSTECIIPNYDWIKI